MSVWPLVLLATMATAIKAHGGSYNESHALHLARLCAVSYCQHDHVDQWNCSPCAYVAKPQHLHIIADVKENFQGIVGYSENHIVIAFRGSMDTKNWLDNLSFLKTRPWSDLPEVYVHQGFYWVYKSIAKQLWAALSELRATYPHAPIIVTGHSLGAATAALLSIFLKPKYPRVRCLAFSPPGCLMSPSLAQASAMFITSVVLGKDIIARASLLSMQDLRDEVLELIGRSKVSKAAIMRQALSWKNPRDLLHAADDVATSSFTTQLTNYKSMLQQIQDHEPIHEMWLPGRVIHLKRQVRSQKRGFCMCCRPGTGICCTDRTDYDCAWSDATKFLKIYVSRTMLDDHFPDKVHAVLQDLAKTKKQT